MENRDKKTNKRSVDNSNRLLPQAVEMERAVLGALMIDDDAYGKVSQILKAECFYVERHQLIYEAIEMLLTEGIPVDILIVTEQLERNGTLDTVGGPMYIVELVTNVASSANIEYHARIVAQKYLARKMINYSREIENKAFDATVDIDDVMAEADNELLQIHQKCSNRDYEEMSEVVKDGIEEMMADASCPDGITGVPTFHSLDMITGGFQKNDLIIIAARPAMGKTAFALSCAKKIAVDNNIPTAFFTLEMSGVQLIKRLFSNVCEIEGSKVNRGQLTQEEWDRFDKRISSLEQAPLYIADTPGLNVGDFRVKAMRLVKEKEVKIIFVDYLQLMNYNGKRFSTKQEEIGAISNTLKSIAKELGIPIVVLSQLNRAVENRDGLDGKRPRLSDLRESGSIEQDADLVLFLYRPEYYGIIYDEKGENLIGKAEVIVAKHRRGATKISPGIMMTYEKEFTRFEDEEMASF